MNIRDHATQIWDAWKAAGCPGTWGAYLADTLQQQPIYLVTVNDVPAQAFREEHDAENFIDHHETPNLCAIVEVKLTE